MKVGTRYCLKAQRAIGQLRFWLPGEKPKPLDYIHVTQNGVVHFQLTAPGPFAGSTLHWVVKFCAAWSSQFERMCSGEVEFKLEGDKTFLYCYTKDSKVFRIEVAVASQ